MATTEPLLHVDFTDGHPVITATVSNDPPKERSLSELGCLAAELGFQKGYLTVARCLRKIADDMETLNERYKVKQ